MNGRHIFLFLAILLLGMAEIPFAKAADREERVIVDADARFGDGLAVWVPRLLLRVENRFDADSVKYEQFTLGISHVWNVWLKTAVYTTPREVFSSQKPDAWKNVHGADVIFSWTWKHWTLADRETVEWHVTDDFVRSRNQADLRFDLHPRLQLFGFYEWRWDLDAVRVNMQTAGGGLIWRVRPSWSMRIVFADELNRRGLDDWKAVHFTAMILSLSL